MGTDQPGWSQFVICQDHGTRALPRPRDHLAAAGEPVDGGLGEELVVHEAEPFIRGPVGGDDGGVVAVPGDGQLVEVGGGGLVQRGEGEVVDDQQVDGGEAAVLGFGAVVQPGGLPASAWYCNWSDLL